MALTNASRRASSRSVWLPLAAPVSASASSPFTRSATDVRNMKASVSAGWRATTSEIR